MPDPAKHDCNRPRRQEQNSQEIDWHELVRHRLEGLALDPAEMREVHAELVAHFEESYEAFRAEGLRRQDAVQRTLLLAGDWQDLRRQIAIAKNGGHPMKNRLRHIWIPGLLAFALFTILLILLQQLPFQPHLVFRNVGYLPWLLPLPCLGALAAYLSFRAGGSRRAALLAGLFPILGLAFAFLFMFPAGLFLERLFGWHVDFRNVAADFLSSPIASLLVPTIALLLGALPTQFFLSRRAAPSAKAVS
ncbi:MAG TPA: hypothetical protein VKP58_13590 [Candidatus Acidoferrum sp.]|nr:hypothetical protein [Candidatus Acidoferrum sp.]